MDDRNWVTIGLVAVVYLFTGFVAAIVAHDDARPRDVVLLHFLAGFLVCAAVFLAAVASLLKAIGLFLAGAWQDFCSRFR